MPPELRSKRSKESTISAAKPAKKVKATAPASKRKAAEDASPVAAKKSKSIKGEGRSKTPKSSRSASTSKKEKPEIDAEAEDAQSSDDENNEAQALAHVVDSDDEDAVVDADAAFQEGQDVGEAPKATKQLAKSSNSGDSEPGVVYVGRVPHGFFEHEMRSYFSQFGTVNKIRLSRNKRTAASKHFAFVEFAEAAVAEVVAKTMDNYLLFGHILKCKLVPKSQVHENLWKGSTNKRFKKVPWNKMAGNRLKKPKSESTWTGKITKEEEKRSERAKKLLDMGYEFDAPALKVVEHVAKEPAALEGADEETPKAIEAAAEATDAKPKVTGVEVEVETEIKPVEDGGELVVKKKSTKKIKETEAKPSKKAKKSSKTRKASS